LFNAVIAPALAEVDVSMTAVAQAAE